ncbi:ABC transporter permease [Cohnella algarum]|uniref:ABC transporter permease n=1 Tax=Cohnella algarum TaxID=2044859 RepID=UPI001F07A7D2|nr:ABC transporter permease [Cohnella algarum]
MSEKPMQLLLEKPVKPGGYVKLKWRQVSQGISVTMTLAALLIVWQALYWVFPIPEYLVPSPLRIAERFIQDFASLMRHAGYTLTEVLAGFFLSVLIGIPVAILIVSYRYFANTVYPILVGVHCIPMVAMAPLLVIWFGYEMKTKILIVFLISFFPIVINAVIGLQSMDKEMYSLARSMRASRLQIFTYFRLPKALPSMFGALRSASLWRWSGRSWRNSWRAREESDTSSWWRTPSSTRRWSSARYSSLPSWESACFISCILSSGWRCPGIKA